MNSTVFRGFLFRSRGRPAAGIVVAITGGATLYAALMTRSRGIVDITACYGQDRMKSAEEAVSDVEEKSRECDCAPLWNCMTSGGDCKSLRVELESCLAMNGTAKRDP